MGWKQLKFNNNKSCYLDYFNSTGGHRDHKQLQSKGTLLCIKARSGVLVSVFSAYCFPAQCVFAVCNKYRNYTPISYSCHFSSNLHALTWSLLQGLKTNMCQTFIKKIIIKHLLLLIIQECCIDQQPDTPHQYFTRLQRVCYNKVTVPFTLSKVLV